MGGKFYAKAIEKKLYFYSQENDSETQHWD